MNIVKFTNDYLSQISLDGCTCEVAGNEDEATVTLIGDSSSSVAKRLSRAIKNDYSKKLYAQLSDFNHSQFKVWNRI